MFSKAGHQIHGEIPNEFNKYVKQQLDTIDEFFTDKNDNENKKRVWILPRTRLIILVKILYLKK